MISLDKNSDSVRFLTENAKINRVDDRVTIFEGDNRLIAEEWVGKCDRVLMGYLPSAEPFIERALQFSKPERSILHYHYIAKKEESEDIPKQHFGPWLTKFNRSLQILHVENVKSYAPQLFHYTADLLITTASS